MKILCVVPSYYPAFKFGGPIFSVHGLNKALVKKGIDITVYTTNAGLENPAYPNYRIGSEGVAVNTKVNVDGIKVFYFSFNKLFEFLGATGWQFSMPMTRALEANIKNFDIVYIVAIWNYPVSMAARCCRKHKKPYIISPRGLLYPYTVRKKFWKKWLYYRLVSKKDLEGACAVHYTTEDEKEKCHQSLGLKNEAVVIPNGIDVSEFKDLPTKTSLTNHHPFLKDKKTILFLGRLNWKKGLDVLAKAYGKIAQERTDVYLVIAGNDESGYGHRVRYWLKERGVLDRALFTGMVTGRDKLEVYSGSDIFVLPSYSENFGMTVIEAMACGLPVIISNQVGIHKEVALAKAGIVISAKVEQLARTLNDLLDNASGCKEMGENGRRLVHDKFTVDKAADGMIALFKKVLYSVKLPISVIALTYNEEENIADCLKSVYDWVDEIFVVDSGSTDKTIEAAKSSTDKIYKHPFENFAQQRNWAQDNLPIRNEWVFHLDADERVSPELAAKLKDIFSSGVNVDGFMMSRKTIFRGRWIKYGGHYPVYHLRLFKKSKGRSEERFYDQNYIVKGEILKVKGDIINIINPDLSVWRERHKRWARLEAKEVLFNKERIMNIRFFNASPIERRNWLRYEIYYKMPLFIRPILYFFYRYILRLGFLDGRQGLIFHFWQGFWYRFLVDMEILRKCLSLG